MSKSVCFSGHRPNKLYGYDFNDKRYVKLYYKINDYLKDLINNKYDTFYTGGALGLDTIAFCAINQLKKQYDIKNILAIPFLNQPNNWFKKEDIIRYNKMKSIADEVIYVDKLDNYKIQGYKENIYNPVKMQKRNEFMVDNSDIVISVWNKSKKGGTYNCIKYAQKQGKVIVNINPNTLLIEVIN